MTIFALADRLHMTVGDLVAKMSVREFTEWLAYAKIRRERDGGG
jgi:hypothetical protein